MAVDHWLTFSGTAYFLKSGVLNLVGEISGCGSSRFTANGICPRGKHYHHLCYLWELSWLLKLLWRNELSLHLFLLTFFFSPLHYIFGICVYFLKSMFLRSESFFQDKHLFSSLGIWMSVSTYGFAYLLVSHAACPGCYKNLFCLKYPSSISVIQTFQHLIFQSLNCLHSVAFRKICLYFWSVYSC